MTGGRDMQIPDSPEKITAGWLSEAVQDVAPGARATAVEVVDAHSGTTGRARLRVRWSEGDLPEAVFAKLAPTDPIQRVMAVQMGMGAREARFYHELGREMPVRVPRPICSHWAEDGSAYLMLGEDLCEAGCRFPDFATGSDPAVVRSAVEELARLHAAFWDSPRFAGDLAWIAPPMRGDMGVQLIGTGISKFGNQQPAAFHDVAHVYLEHNEAYCELLDRGTPTLLHGDPHLGNFFVEGDRVGFLDWACVARGPALRDVGYFLGSSVETGLRRAEERGLIERYLTVLAELGAPAPGFEEAWRGYRRYVVCAWIAAVATLAAGDRMQSLEVGRRAVSRSNAAIEDLGTAELLAEELGL